MAYGLAFSLHPFMFGYLLFRISANGILGDRNEFKLVEPFGLINVVSVELMEDVALNGLKSFSRLN